MRAVKAVESGFLMKDNLLLASLSEAERHRLDPFLKHVALEFGQVLIEPEQPITQLYFLIDAISSTTQ